MAKKRPDGFPKLTLKNISRTEPKYYGWRVLIKRGGKSHWRHFPDGPDGPFSSLRAAILWRDAQWLRLGPPSRVGTNARNRSTAGVWHEVQRTPSGLVVENFVARWLDADGKRHKRSFSIDKYGKAEARSRAEAARRAGAKTTEHERHRRMLEMLHMHRTLLHE